MHPGFGPYNSPGQPGLYFDDNKIVYDNPKNFEYPKNQFFDFVSAQIKSTSTRSWLIQPLIVQEGESSALVLALPTQQVNSTVSSQAGTTSVIKKRQRQGFRLLFLLSELTTMALSR